MIMIQYLGRRQVNRVHQRNCSGTTSGHSPMFGHPHSRVQLQRPVMSSKLMPKDEASSETLQNVHQIWSFVRVFWLLDLSANESTLLLPCKALRSVELSSTILSSNQSFAQTKDWRSTRVWNKRFESWVGVQANYHCWLSCRYSHFVDHSTFDCDIAREEYWRQSAADGGHIEEESAAVGGLRRNTIITREEAGNWKRQYIARWIKYWRLEEIGRGRDDSQMRPGP